MAVVKHDPTVTLREQPFYHNEILRKDCHVAWQTRNVLDRKTNKDVPGCGGFVEQMAGITNFMDMLNVDSFDLVRGRPDSVAPYSTGATTNFERVKKIAPDDVGGNWKALRDPHRPVASRLV